MEKGLQPAGEGQGLLVQFPVGRPDPFAPARTRRHFHRHRIGPAVDRGVEEVMEKLGLEGLAEEFEA